MSESLADKVKYTGGCACGEIRYGFYEPKVAQLACHCRACQYAAGGGPTYVVTVHRDVFRVTKGRPEEFTTLSEEGNHVTRTFCGSCGTPLYAFNDAQSDFCAIKVGSLDEPETFKPRLHIWMSEAQSWHKRGLFIRQFRRNPPGTGSKRDPSKPTVDGETQ